MGTTQLLETKPSLATDMQPSNRPAPKVLDALSTLSPEDRSFLVHLVERVRAQNGEKNPLTRIQLIHAMATETDYLPGKPLDSRPGPYSYTFNNPPPVLPAQSGRELVSLPRDPGIVKTNLNEAIQRRRSANLFSPEPMSAVELGTLLYLSYGVRDHMTAYNRKHFPLRYAPSSGGLQSIDLVVSIHNVESFAPGIYRYHPEHNALEAITLGLVKRKIVQACAYTEWVGHSAVVIMLISDLRRLEWKYGHRSYFMTHVDCGAVAENLHLVSTGLQLSSNMIAGFRATELESLLDLEAQYQVPLLLLAVGKPTRSELKWAEIVRS